MRSSDGNHPETRSRSPSSREEAGGRCSALLSPSPPPLPPGEGSLETDSQHSGRPRGELPQRGSIKEKYSLTVNDHVTSAASWLHFIAAHPNRHLRLGGRAARETTPIPPAERGHPLTCPPLPTNPRRSTCRIVMRDTTTPTDTALGHETAALLFTLCDKFRL